MIKNLLKYITVITMLFSFSINYVFAYEYINSESEDVVNRLLDDIYTKVDQYEYVYGESNSDDVDILDGTSTYYWWPIGSQDTIESDGAIFAQGTPHTVYISSNFGYRDDPFGRGVRFHSGLDITGGGGPGVVNIIAAKDGIVVYPSDKDPMTCPSSNTVSDCGGSYGNYVVIQHSDGNYTLYGHLYENSITVRAGDAVRQGQVIGKMGSSGSSTGAHLHFEIRKGQNIYGATVDPLDYISPDNPRPISTGAGGEFLDWLHSWEGTTGIVDNSYKVIAIGDGVRTVGGGVTLENNPSRFAARGININDYPVGTTIPIEIVDSIEIEIVNEFRSSVQNTLASNSITLNEKQIDALVSRKYNTGNINGFAEAYKKYGNTNDLYDNWFFSGYRAGTKFEKGLKRRRNAEWALFNRGEYVYNG